jgi:DNA polymerase-3 subunit beta
MKFVVSQNALQNELQFLQGIAEKKKTIPILSNILLRAESDFLTLAATDLEVSLTGGCEARVEEAGGITVSAKKIFEVVRSLEGDEISFSLSDSNWLEITCGNSFFRLVGLSPDDFPDVPVNDFSSVETIGHDAFKDLISRTIFAVTQEDARYALNGALLEMDSTSIRMVATDAHRLAMVEEASSSGAEVRAIVPKKTLTELRNLASEDEMLFAQDEHHLFFKIGHRVLATRVIEGQFPSYEKVIPAENPLEIVFAKEPMAGAIRRVSLLASERSRAVRFKFGGGEATISSSNPELGEAIETVAVQYEGEELEVSFNAQYVLDFLSAVDGEEVVFRLKDPASQGLLEPREQSSESSRYKYVIMPMRM